jgi:hypothetical protein
MSKREIPSYRLKFGTPPSKYHYTSRKCLHNNTHVERSPGGPYEVCDACNTIRKNLRKDRPVLLKAA